MSNYTYIITCVVQKIVFCWISEA